jgi:hypothetical protein
MCREYAGHTGEKEKKLFNNNRRLERQGSEGREMPASFRLGNVDRDDEFLPDQSDS